MEKLFDALGLNPQILIAQFVNFAILLFILYKLGYKPIMKFVQERTDKIEKGLKDAQSAAKTLENAQEEQEKILTEATKKGQEIIAQAKEHAGEQATKIAEEKKAELQRTADRLKGDIIAERDKALRDTREQAVAMVLAATEKLLREKVDVPADQAFVEKVMAEVK